MKKNIKWIGYIIIIIYISITIFLIFLGYQRKDIDRDALIPGGMMIFLGIPLIPFLYRLTLLFSLKSKTEFVKVISKNTVERGSRYLRSLWHHYFLTFQFPDYSTKYFDVPAKVYQTVFENDEGYLVYRNYRRITFFLNFIKK